MSNQQTRNQRGFTLMEVIFSLALSGIALAMVTPAFIFQSQSNVLSEKKSQALEATQRAIDSLRLNSPSTLPSTGRSVQSITIGSRAFSITTYYCLNAALCSAVSRHLTFKTSFNGKQLYATETVFTELR